MYFKDFKWEFPKFKNLIFKFFSQRIKNKILAQFRLAKSWLALYTPQIMAYWKVNDSQYMYIGTLYYTRVTY